MNPEAEPMIVVEDFDPSQPWPFHPVEHHLYLFAETAPYGVRFCARWHPVTCEPAGFILGKMDYQSAANATGVMITLAPLFDAFLRCKDEGRKRALMRSTATCAVVLSEEITEMSSQWFDKQWLGFEAFMLSEEGTA